MVYLIVMLKGCCMLRYTLCLALLAALLAGACALPAAANSFANVNMYGYPVVLGQGGGEGMGVPGGSYTVTNPGLGISDVTSRYGILTGSAAAVSPQQPYCGYVGPNLNGISLGVNFGYPTASHDASTTAYAKDMAYEADLDNAFIAFPGLGVGSQGIGFPSLTSNKASIRYAESVRFQLTAESDTLPIGAFMQPFGLGIGYSSVGLYGGGTGMTSGGLGMPFYFGTGQ